MTDYEQLILEREERESHSELETLHKLMIENGIDPREADLRISAVHRMDEYNPKGYVNCACRDCFEIAIASDSPPRFCHECEAAGCELDSECQREDAYGVDGYE